MYESTSHRQAAWLAVVLLAALAAGCSETATDLDRFEETATPVAAIFDASHTFRGHEGNPGFHLLFPLVEPRGIHFTGPADLTLEPRIELCVLDKRHDGLCGAEGTTTFSRSPVPGEFPIAVVPDEEMYLAVWDASEIDLRPGAVYRANFYIGDERLGFADIRVARNVFQAIRELLAQRRTRTGDRDFAAIIRGQPHLPLPFRLEKGVVETDPAPLPPGTVGPDGGRVAGAGWVIEIPKGAVASPVAIDLVPVNFATFPMVGSALPMPGSTFDGRPNGLRFAQPAWVLLDYDDSVLPPGADEGGIVLIGDVGGTLSFAQTAVDPAGNQVSGFIDGFSPVGVGIQGGSIQGAVTLAPPTAGGPGVPLAGIDIGIQGDPFARTAPSAGDGSYFLVAPVGTYTVAPIGLPAQYSTCSVQTASGVVSAGGTLIANIVIDCN